MKDGVYTTEFWLAAITSVVVASLGILVGYNVLTAEQADLWQTFAVAFAPLALALVSIGYGMSRKGVKESFAWVEEQKQIAEKSE